jgi:hypothetical protein
MHSTKTNRNKYFYSEREMKSASNHYDKTSVLAIGTLISKKKELKDGDV